MEHLAVILDGNRRYAVKNLKDQKWGHFEGANRVEDLITWAIELKIPVLTLYVLSLKNMNRIGIAYIYDLIADRLEKAMQDGRVHENKVCIRVLGRKENFPKKLTEVINRTEKETRSYNKLQLNLAIGYDGRAELVDSFKKIANQIKQGKLSPEKIDESVIEKNLYFSQAPDLIIRTGGENRLSGFLLWGASYSEFFFTSTLWPEFSKQELLKAVETFDKTERRFGL